MTASVTVASTTLEPGGSAGFLALLLLVLLFVATGLLIRNMSGRLKRLPKQFDQPDVGPGVGPGTPDIGPGPAGTGPVLGPRP